MFSIYKLQIEDYIYYGKTKNYQKRITNHKYSCNCRGDTNYNHYVYEKIRELGGWSKVKYEIVEEDINEDESYYIEKFYINTISDEKSLNIQKNRSKTEYMRDWRKANPEKSREIGKKADAKRREYRSEKLQCPYCEKKISRRNLKRHIKRIHNSN